MRNLAQPSGKERFFDAAEIIVSKTDLGGRITYANDVFIRISGYTELELLGQAHSLIRHPDMPRCVFDLLWSTLKSGEEIFAYVNNLCKNGDHYWVLAHITPTFDSHGGVLGYHSNRRVPSKVAVETITALYRLLVLEEEKYGRSIEGMRASNQLLLNHLAANDAQYDEYIFSLANAG